MGASPSGPVFKTLYFQCRDMVQSLVRELRCHVLHSAVKKNKIKLQEYVRVSRSGGHEVDPKACEPRGRASWGLVLSEEDVAVSAK